MRSGAQGAFKAAELRPWRKPVESQTLTLPFPPSVNTLFFNIPSRGGRGVTELYRKWRYEASLEVMRQRSGRVAGPVELRLCFEEQFTKAKNLPRIIDLDGLIKAPLDLLVSMGVIDGDHQEIVRKITLGWGPVRGCHVAIVKAAV